MTTKMRFGFAEPVEIHRVTLFLAELVKSGLTFEVHVEEHHMVIILTGGY